MLQQSLALIIIFVIVLRLVSQKRKNNLRRNEFIFWLAFWIMAGLAVIFIKQIDLFLAGAGFSSSGIDFLQYISIVALFYFIFRLRLKVEILERNTTKIIRELAIREADKN